jgi:A/G-specific adenine glycosylase
VSDHGPIVTRLLGWFGRHARDLPWRRTRDPYAIWVSEIMLQQTQVKTVLPYWQRWMRALPTVRALAQAKPQRIHKLWEGLGYYSRARNLLQAARLVVEQHNGEVPAKFEELLALPGIGRYTAGAVCSIAFNQPAPILDGNVLRVLTRLFALHGNPREKKVNARLWDLAAGLVGQADEMQQRAGQNKAARVRKDCCSQFNQALMELGALVCTPTRPRCDECPVVTHCLAHNRGRVETFPELQRRSSPTPKRCVAFVVERRGRFLVRQRPAGVVNAHFWEFPNLELGLGESQLKEFAFRTLGAKPRHLEPLCRIKHSITRYRITLEVFWTLFSRHDKLPPTAGEWRDWRDLNRLPFASAHKRILKTLSRNRSSKK